jgi:hypothetical protein
MNGTYAVIADLYRVHAARAFRKATSKLARDDGGLTRARHNGYVADFQIEAVKLPASPCSPPYCGINARRSSRAASVKALRRVDHRSAFHQVIQLLDSLARC